MTILLIIATGLLLYYLQYSNAETVKTMIHKQTGFIKEQGEKIMEHIDLLTEALGKVKLGVGGVSDEVKALQAQIADLSTKLGDEPALIAGIDAATTIANSIIDSLAAIQAVPTPVPPAPSDGTPANPPTDGGVAVTVA